MLNMSTRCQIGFYQKPGPSLHQPLALIYRHSDGYPEGVLPEILPYCLRFDQARGMGDTEYLAARLLAHLVAVHDGIILSIPGTDPERVPCLGYGISDDFHGDLEYYYAVYGTGLIAVYEVDYDREKDWRIIFKKIGSLSVKDVPDEQSAANWSRFYRKTVSGQQDT